MTSLQRAEFLAYDSNYFGRLKTLLGFSHGEIPSPAGHKYHCVYYKIQLPEWLAFSSISGNRTWPLHLWPPNPHTQPLHPRGSPWTLGFCLGHISVECESNLGQEQCVPGLLAHHFKLVCHSYKHIMLHFLVLRHILAAVAHPTPPPPGSGCHPEHVSLRNCR